MFEIIFNIDICLSTCTKDLINKGVNASIDKLIEQIVGVEHKSLWQNKRTFVGQNIIIIFLQFFTLLSKAKYVCGVTHGLI
jgi:hypothetical protein